MTFEVLELGIYPKTASKKERHLVRMVVMKYILCGGQLYWRSYDEVRLHCLKKNEAGRTIEEINQGIFGPQKNGKMLAKKILRMEY